MKIHKGDTNTILKNAHLHSSSKFINLAHVKLVGSGAIYYVGNPTKEKIVANNNHLLESCTAKKKDFEVRYNFETAKLPLKKDDILIWGAGHHKERELYLSGYHDFLQCIKNMKKDDPQAFKN